MPGTRQVISDREGVAGWGSLEGLSLLGCGALRGGLTRAGGGGWPPAFAFPGDQSGRGAAWVQMVGQAAGRGRNGVVVLVGKRLGLRGAPGRGARGCPDVRGGVTGGASPAQVMAPVPLRFAVWPEKPRMRTSECRDRLTMADACALHGTVLFPVGRTRRDIPKSWLH